MKPTLFSFILIGVLSFLLSGELNAQTPADTQRASSLGVELSVGSNIGSKAAATGKPTVVFTSSELQIKQVQNTNNTVAKKNKRVVFTSPELQQKRNNR